MAAVTSEASPKKSNTPRDGSEKTMTMKKSSKRSPADRGQKPQILPREERLPEIGMTIKVVMNRLFKKIESVLFPKMPAPNNRGE